MKQLPPGDLTPMPMSQGAPQNGAVARPQYVEASDSQFSDDPAGGTLLEYWRILQRRKGTVLLVAFLGMLGGFLYTLPQTPVYQARTSIEIQGINEDFMRMREVTPNTNSNYFPDYDIQTQVRILQSRALLDRAIKKIDVKKKPLITDQSRLAVWRQTLGLTPAKPVDSAEGAVRAAAGSLKVRAQTNTRIVEISCDSTDPNLAAKFANTLTSEFIEQNLEARWQTTQHTGEWLSRQMEELKIKLEKSEEALQAYTRQTGLVFTQEKDNVAEQKLKQLQDELSRAQADRIAKQSRYELARSAPADTLGEVLDNQGMKDLGLRLAELRRQYAELSSAYTAKHSKVRNVQAQLAALEAGMNRERSNIVSRIQNDFESAQRREKLLSSDYASHVKLISDQADKVAHYDILKREVDMNRQLYENMLQRLKESSIASALRASNIRVVDPAQPPKGPYKPNVFMNTTLGLMAGMFLGVAFVVFRERADCTIKEPGDSSFYLGVPELGVVPNAAADRSHSLVPHRHRKNMDLVTIERRQSAVAESFHATLTSILFSGQNGGHPRVIVVSSAAPQEGKTTVCANLAVALAEIQQRVLLIDADVRKPRLHNIFGVDNDKGLVDLLRRSETVTAPLNGHVHVTRVPNLSVMTSGSSAAGDPRLLYSRRLAELIKLVCEEYDMVLIDTPPMLTMPDARVVARHGDAVLLVARASQTSRDSLRDAYQRFLEDGTAVLGTVLNDWNPKRSNRYGYYRYYDKYKHYYGSGTSGSR